MEYKYGDITATVIAAAMEVHNVLGNGFQERIYQKSLELELAQRGVMAVREVYVSIFYKGQIVGARRVDFLINENICLELKAVTKLEDVHVAQALNYLEAFNIEVGLLLNFGNRSLEVKRLFNKKYNPMLKVIFHSIRGQDQKATISQPPPAID